MCMQQTMCISGQVHSSEYVASTGVLVYSIEYTYITELLYYVYAEDYVYWPKYRYVLDRVHSSEYVVSASVPAYPMSICVS